MKDGEINYNNEFYSSRKLSKNSHADPYTWTSFVAGKYDTLQCFLLVMASVEFILDSGLTALASRSEWVSRPVKCISINIHPHTLTLIMSWTLRKCVRTSIFFLKVHFTQNTPNKALHGLISAKLSFLLCPVCWMERIVLNEQNFSLSHIKFVSYSSWTGGHVSIPHAKRTLPAF